MQRQRSVSSVVNSSRAKPFSGPRQGTVASRAPESEESMIVDARAFLRPAQMVENKLVLLLKNGGLPISQVLMRAGYSGRTHC
jgi:hypothetical protein